MEVGGIEPHTRIVAQGLTPHCDHIVTTFLPFNESCLDSQSSLNKEASKCEPTSLNLK